MSTTTPDLKLYFRRKHAPSPSVLLLTHDTSDEDRQHYINPIEFYSHQPNNRHPPPIIGLHVNHFDVNDTSSSSFGWQRHSDKVGQMTPAPDVAYRYTYMKEIKKEKSNTSKGHHRSYSRSPSPRSQLSPCSKLANSSTSESTPKNYHSHQYRTVYDYIRDSIRQIERQRNSKQQNIYSRVKRPQNADSTLRRALGDNRSSAKTLLSRSSSTTMSPLINNDLKSPQSFVNYINHSRVSRLTTSNQSYSQQPNHEYNRQRPILSQN